MLLTIIPSVKNVMQIMPLNSATALLAVMILPILVVQELTAKISHPRLKTLQRSINLVTVPLLIGFVLAAGLSIYLILKRFYLYIPLP